MKKEIKEKIIEILENSYIEDSPDLILELFEQEKQKWFKLKLKDRIKIASELGKLEQRIKT